MPRSIRLFTALATLVAATGCDSIFGSSERELRREGIISYHEMPVTVSIPSEVTAGVPFQVSVRTYGPGCYSMGGLNVVEVPGGVQLLPYDYLTVNGSQACPQGVQNFDHVAQVTLAAPGDAVLTVIGVSIQVSGASRVRQEVPVQVNPAS